MDEDTELEFIRTRSTGVVHVMMPEPEALTWHQKRLGVQDDCLGLQLVLGVVPTLCGRYLASLHDVEGERVDVFHDGALCGQCHAWLERQGLGHLAFQHEQSEDELSASNQGDRL